MKNRSEIEDKYKWDLSKFCVSDEECKLEAEKLKNFGSIMQKYENKLADDDMLLKFWKDYDKYLLKLMNLGLYVQNKQSEDLSLSSSNELESMLTRIETENAEKLSFSDVEISKFSYKKLNALYKNERFKDYRPLIKQYVRAKKHTLSKREEKLLSGLGDMSQSNALIMQMFCDADAEYEDVLDENGKTHVLNDINYEIFIEGSDRILRENSKNNYLKEYAKHINFLSENFITNIKRDCYFAKVRKFKSALEASLYSDEIPISIYNKLIEMVHKFLKVDQRYFEVKRKMLKLDMFCDFDLYAKLGEENDKNISFEEALEISKKALSPLGEDYVKFLDIAQKEKWFDVYPNKNKRGGAYETACYGKTPIILLNFTGKEEYCSTIVHEFGHAMHSKLTNDKQSLHNSNYTIFAAEVASIVNEMLLARFRLNNAKTKQEKIKILDKILSLSHGTVFRQVMFSEFEKIVHEKYEKGEPLSKDKLCNIYGDLCKLYFGENVVLNKDIDCEWAYIPHFYTSFYVFTYATGFICATLISKKLLEDNQYREKYFKFLSGGCSKSPIELLKDAGIDLEKDENIEEVFKYLSDLIDEFEKLC